MRRTWRDRCAGAARSGIWIPGALVLVWSLAQLARDPGFFWCDDYQAYQLAFFEEIVRSWRDWEWPLLSRNSWCAGNVAGEYQLGTFSPTINLVLLLVWAFSLPLASKAAAVAIVHLVWLATGVFVLGRQRGLPIALATMASLATTLSGWNITWAATNWIAFLVGFSWLPWLWWAWETALADGSVWKRWLRPALFVAMLLVSGHAFGVGMGAIIGLWLAARSLIRNRDWRALGMLAATGALGIGLSAPAWGLLVENATASTRWGWGGVIHHGWLVPWRAWPGLILPSFVVPWPDFFGNPRPHASMELACGLVPAAALAAALCHHPLATLRKLRWELGLLVLAALLVSLPSVGQFRWSFRWLPLFHLVLALTAASALQQGFAVRAAAFGAGLTALAWAVAWFFAANRSPALAAGLLGLSAAWWLGERFLRRSWAAALPAAVVVLSLALTFWHLPTHQAVPKYSFTDQILDPAPLDRRRLYLSLYSFEEIANARRRPQGFGSIVRPVDTMHYAGLRFLNGYSAFDGREVKGLFAPHGNVTRATAESLAGPDGEPLLFFLGVDGIIFSSDYREFARTLGPEWKKFAESDEGVAYHHEPARFTPVKVLQFLFDRPGVPLAQPDLRLIAERRNSVEIEIMPGDSPPIFDRRTAEPSGNAIAPIAFLRPYLNGYRASFEGKPVPVRVYRDILPIVELPADARGTLKLFYRPAELVRGVILTAIAFLAMLLIALFGRRRVPRSDETQLPGANSGRPS